MGLTDFEIEQVEEHADAIEAAGLQPKEARRKSVIIQARKMGNPGPTDDQLEGILRRKNLWDDSRTRKQNLHP